MTHRRFFAAAAALAAVIIIGAVLAVELLVPPRRVEQQAPAPAAPTTAHISATLFFAAPDGQRLLSVRQEVPLADPLGPQILAAQLSPPAPYASAVPKGTKLRAFFVTDRGDAFVDLTPEVSRGHTGGSTAELLTVYAIVNAVTANLPSVRRVQILVDGKEVETLAGHVDVRRPLARDMSLVVQK
jgi:spore germination protein GerM